MHFSGFCFKNESLLFDEFIDKSRPFISSFSYGCIQAMEYILTENIKIDNLYMFSPSFFNTQALSFKNNQLKIFRKSPEKYLDYFYKNCLYDKKINIDNYKKIDNIEILEQLLFYKWQEHTLQKIINKNIKIMVYLGKEDKIIDINEAKEFFNNYASIIEIPNAGHLLK